MAGKQFVNSEQSVERKIFSPHVGGLLWIVEEPSPQLTLGLSSKERARPTHKTHVMHTSVAAEDECLDGFFHLLQSLAQFLCRRA